MPTSRRDRGFTLIELSVVLLVLAVAAALVLPRLDITAEASLRRSARTLAATIRYVQDRAAVTRRSHTVVFDLATDRITVRQPPSEKDEPNSSDPFLDRPLLGDGIRLKDVSAPPLGKVSAGTVEVPVSPLGLPGVLTVHLEAGSAACTVVAYPAGRKVLVLEGISEGTI
ncbi:MAG TPA: prepilin-type N-terminal cleavage/methylation domain-containing protein [Verrucomicrobiae bacterium]|nr:prepilin-type N-terminal cleavage/methylation domain-containing protein [Verrucomicrobiae bacterium]